MPLDCSLAGQRLVVRVGADSHAGRAYGSGFADEEYFCSYGIEGRLWPRLTAAGLQVTGRDPAGDPRVVELAGHPYFVATLFVPQVSSSADSPHPLILSHVRAALARRRPAFE